MGVDFGKFKSKVGRTDDKRTSKRTTTVSKSTPKPDRTDWKGKLKSAEKELKALRKSHAETFNELTELKAWADAVKKDETQMYELKDEIHRLTVQDNMNKKALDKAVMKLAQFQFDPQKFSQLAQLLTYLRVHGNKQALIRVKEIVGTTELSEVRKWIFDLLEAPYK